MARSCRDPTKMAGGRWDFARPVPKGGWPLTWNGLTFTAQTTPFRHLAFLSRHDAGMGMGSGFTGAARERAMPQLVRLYRGRIVGRSRARGAGVTHVDASKTSVEAAKANAALSGMAGKPIRWLIDDAGKFTAREVRRGNRYDGIVLDPPKYGRGPEGEVWRLEEDLSGLIANCRALVDDRSAFVFLTVYAIRLSALAIGELMRQAFGDLPGTVECGELAIREEARGLALPTAIWARWAGASRPTP